MQYKCIPAPRELVIDKNGSHDGAIRSFADLINSEATDGWKFHSMENIAVTQQPGCLAALFGQKETITYFNMLVFSTDKEIINEKFQTTHVVKLLTNSDGMSLRSQPNGNAEPFCKIPNGSEVKFIEQGESVDFNNIKGFWYKIKTESGKIGWCFSGSLSKK